jgi:hypothetical protein
LNFGNVPETTTATQVLTLENSGGAALAGITITTSGAPFSIVATGNGACGKTLGAGATCSITVAFTPTLGQAYTGTVTVTATGVTVVDSPVALTGTGVPPTRTFSVTPAALGFGTWAAGTTSNAQTLTVTNTGNVALAGGSFTIGTGTPEPFTRTGGTCAATLALAATCTVNVTFSPATGTANNTAFNKTLTVGYTGATATPVTLTGTSVTARATAGVTPNPLTITAPSGQVVGTGTVTITNTAPAGGAQMLMGNVAVSGGSFLTYFFTTLGQPNTCTGTVLAPGASCTAGVEFVNVLSARGANRAGTITISDNGVGNSQSGALIGVAK